MNSPLKDIKAGMFIKKQVIIDKVDVKLTKSNTRFLFILLKDDSQTVKAVCFEPLPIGLFQSIKKDIIAEIEGTVEHNNGELSVKIVKITPVFDAEHVNHEDFMDSYPNIDEMEKELFAIISQVKDSHCNALLTKIFSNEQIKARFIKYPAAKNWHHNKIGGLLRHTLETAKIAISIANIMGKVNKDLIIAGALLHDIGKIEELEIVYKRDYTTYGKLLGHISLGTMRIREFIKAIKGFDPEKSDLILHIILSHHGKYEHQSPVLPQIKEAFIVNFADEISAQIEGIDQIKNNSNEGKDWSDYNSLLERMIYFKTNFNPD